MKQNDLHEIANRSFTKILNNRKLIVGNGTQNHKSLKFEMIYCFFLNL